MARLNDENQRKLEELTSHGVKVEITTDQDKFYCHIGPRNNDLPPVYKDTADEAFETALSNYSQGTGKLSG